MPQSLLCPHCARKLTAPDHLAGKRVACPSCRGAVDVPRSSFAPREAESGASAGASSATKSGAVTSAASADVIVVACPQCAKKLKAPPSFAGKRVKCPACQAVVAIPGSQAVSPSAAPAPAAPVAKPGVPTRDTAASRVEPPVDDDGEYELEPPLPGLADLAAAAEASASIPANRLSNPNAPAASSPKAAGPAPKGRSASANAVSSAAATSQRATSSTRAGRRPRFLYLLFALALVPLGVQTIMANRDEAEFEERLARTISAQPEIAEKLVEATSDDEFFAMAPDGRIVGAHLPHHTWVHWLYGFLAAAVFLFVIRGLFEPGESTVVQLLLAMAITATVGIVSLLMFQFLAEWSQGVWVRGRGIVVLLFYIVKFIGFSYHAALDPENGFFLSLLGFTFGVGLCEEITKVIPAIGLLGDQKRLDWRAPCALGLASGVGFGVAEGIMYSSDMYNGVAYGDIYLTRFISCVALHAVWAAAASIFAAERIKNDNASEMSDVFTAALMAIAVPALLHGLYDTLLKRDMPGYALVAAAASFVWLAFVIERARGFDAPERSGMRSALA